MVHQYRSNGYNIVLDVESGAVHLVDDLVYELIPVLEDAICECLSAKEAGDRDDGSTGFEPDDTERICALACGPALRDRYGPDELREAALEICELASSGQLFSRDEYRRYADSFGSGQPVVKALCLHIAHDCNLSCRYCFAEEGEYKGKRELMSLEVGKKALDFLIENSYTRRNLEVDFFGGEPLLNWEVVKALVEYGRKREKESGKNFRFTLTTNGTLLDDRILEFANREMSNIVCSIDGRKEINDMMRPYRGMHGKGTYDVILPRFKKVASSRDQNNYYVRGTYTHFNTDFAQDVIHLMDEGFEQISVEPVVASSDKDYAIRQEDLSALLEQYDILAQEIIKRRKEGRFVNFFHFMIDLEGGPCVAKRLSGCGAGSEYLAVTPWGDLYPCHQFVGMEDFLLGNVFSGIKRDDIRKKFRSCNVYTKEKCSECFAKYYCSGGCMANSYNFSGDINGSYDIGCALQKKRIECAIAIKAALS